VFRTNKVYVKDGFSSDKKDIKLKFDLLDIEKEIEKDRKIEEAAKQFMNEYTRDLNTAYEKRSFSLINRYFKPNSELANHIKYMVESKKNENGNTIEIELIKKDKNKKKIKLYYVLDYSKQNNEFQLISYHDILG